MSEKLKPYATYIFYRNNTSGITAWETDGNHPSVLACKRYCTF